MKFVTTLVGAAALAISSFSVNSAPMTAGGVVWDEYGLGGIAGSINFQQWYSPDAFDATSGITNNTLSPALGLGYLTGAGAIMGLFDGRTPSGDIFGGAPYCVTTGCLLTFSFGGLAVQSFSPTSGFVFNTSQAWLNIYYHSTVPALGGINTNLYTKFTQIQSGSSWAKLSFDNALLRGNDLSGAGGTFEALLSFDSGVPEVMTQLSGKNISDIFLNSSAFIGSSGRSDLASGQFQSIPEPASIALLGLGLLGLVGGRRFRKS